MFEKVEKIEKKYQELGETLSKPDVIQDYEKFRDLSRQRKTMEETVNIYYKYIQKLKNKPIKLYLYSIIENKIKELKIEPNMSI